MSSVSPDQSLKLPPLEAAFPFDVRQPTCWGEILTGSWSDSLDTFSYARLPGVQYSLRIRFPSLQTTTTSPQKLSQLLEPTGLLKPKVG